MTQPHALVAVSISKTPKWGDRAWGAPGSTVDPCGLLSRGGSGRLVWSICFWGLRDHTPQASATLHPSPQRAAPPPRRDQRHLHLHVPMHISRQGGTVEDEVLHHHIQGQSRSPVRNRLVQGTRWLLLSFQLLLHEKNDSAGKARCWGGEEGPSLGPVWGPRTTS